MLIIAASSDADRLSDKLVARGLPATKIASVGGFLRRGSTTILSGVEDGEVESVLDLVRQECKSRREFVPLAGLAVLGEPPLTSEQIEVKVGGATVFVMNVDQLHRF